MTDERILAPRAGSGGEREARNAAPAVVSVYRAGVCSILCPGWGDWLAGHPVRGVALLMAVLACLGWFSWLAAHLALAGVAVALGGEESPPAGASWQLPAAGLGMLWAWFLSVWLSVDAARRLREEAGAPAQRHPGWLGLFAWFAPGSAQAALEERGRGAAMLAVHCAGFLFLVGVLADTAQAARMYQPMVGQGQPLMTMASQMAAQVGDFMESLLLRAEFTLQWQAAAIFKAWTMADAMERVGRRDRTEPAAFQVWAMFGHLALGWICPGAGQLLQGRRNVGWLVFAAAFGVQGLAALLLWAGNLATADLHAVILAGNVIRVAAGVEACWRLARPASA